MNEAEIEFRGAIAVARHAREQFDAAPMVPSKRGGPRTSSWFRCWKEASEIAQRWHRQLELDKPEPSIDDEIDRLLADAGGDGGNRP